MEAFEFTVSRVELLERLEVANRISAMAWVEIHDRECIQVDAMSDSFSKDMSIATMLTGVRNVRGKVGSRIVLHSTVAIAMLKTLHAEEVLLRHTREGWASVRSDRDDATFQLVLGNVEEAKRFKWRDHVVEFRSIDRGPMLDLINHTLFSVCTDATRFHLTGLLFESDGDKASMVSTDGHRLSRAERKIAGAPILETGVVISGAVVREIKHALETQGGQGVGIAVQEPYLFLKAGRTVLVSKLMDTPFPPYEQVIPKGNALKVQVYRQQLLGALARVQVMNSRHMGIRLHVDGQRLVLESMSPDHGDSICRIPCEGSTLAPHRAINPTYLSDLVGSMTSERVVMEFSEDELSPIAVRDPDEGSFGVIMPMSPWKEAR
jgi:DNA polymerase III sliding clamp (beta) subunit (PCNA family)